jgi:hypothetical protein
MINLEQLKNNRKTNRSVQINGRVSRADAKYIKDKGISPTLLIEWAISELRRQNGR